MTKFKDLKYEKPDMESFHKDYLSKVDLMEKAKDADDFNRVIIEADQVFGKLMTSYTLAYIRNTMDTSDEFYKDEIDFFNQEIPRLIPISKKYRDIFLKSPFKDDAADFFSKEIISMAEAEDLTQSEAIMEELVAEAMLGSEYQELVAKCQVEFKGQDNNFYGLLKHMQSQDRETRKEAYLAWAKLYEGVSDSLDDIYDKLIKIRVEIAKKLGFASYTDFAYKSRMRAYTKEEVAFFREQVVKYIVPFSSKLAKDQAKRLGLEGIKYYDESFVFPDGNPMPVGDKDYMLKQASKMYEEMSPFTHEFFEHMTKYDLFDLETRPKKHLGGYCTSLPSFKAPFIFSNFNGTAQDVDVLTHEAGHAFEYYLSSRKQKLTSLAFSTNEVNEIHSMSMEFFAYPWLEAFFGDNVNKYKYYHLVESLTSIPYIVCVDHFQHEIYDNPNMTRDERYALWKRLEAAYLPDRDYDGVGFLEKGGFWMQKQHIFLYPFYYIDYSLAVMNAFEFYARMGKDYKKAFNDYVELCSLGGSLSYFELLESANLSSPFEEGTVYKVTKKIMEDIGKLGY